MFIIFATHNKTTKNEKFRRKENKYRTKTAKHCQESNVGLKNPAIGRRNGDKVLSLYAES